MSPVQVAALAGAVIFGIWLGVTFVLRALSQTHGRTDRYVADVIRKLITLRQVTQSIADDEHDEPEPKRRRRNRARRR